MPMELDATTLLAPQAAAAEPSLKSGTGRSKRPETSSTGNPVEPFCVYSVERSGDRQIRIRKDPEKERV